LFPFDPGLKIGGLWHNGDRGDRHFGDVRHKLPAKLRRLAHPQAANQLS
jgi:hypothetical protein